MIAALLCIIKANMNPSMLSGRWLARPSPHSQPKTFVNTKTTKGSMKRDPTLMGLSTRLPT
ncbi:uncharacterized protein N7515_002377 [Penicillium bovifimosum]|uniref:Uncharacterized protein n=1 Tax=Penicillium bovifimosum TaxID=126998 RepID=A0A9W9HC42_9EURO|nr:uncharacterized protein N7515_002377 [Penicillium bovifimosum]KAJ5143590.1 hypothetical protein N7515_002377 [Penicillium bovifimosum]